ncbi:DUF4345 family protein [Sciscionella sediminilitoris]|uniref:DUF4345 family protein n=1 Tax=Sciscionella sediminilitoris TaxID=1445613 RepID=UPI0004DF31B8|nr:DUF4345 family protein [Sciscionella sp. SE31]
MSTVLILIVCAFFLGMGCYALIAPAALARPFRLSVDSSEARAEVRAVYGGFGLAIAAVLLLAALDLGGIRAGVVCTVVAALGGMALGRLLSALFDRPGAFYPVWCYFLVELLGTALLLAAW